MQQKHAFIFALLLTLLVASNIYLITNLNKPERKTVLITRVIDGDTLEIENGETIRLLNINTPEKGISGFEGAKQFLVQFENKTVEIEKVGSGKYGRVLARIYTPNYLNLEIIQKGLGTKFLVDNSELELFSKAEKSAIESSLGIWKKSQYFNCFKSEIDSKEEVISIKNTCGDISLANWIISDESRKEYKFPDISFAEINPHTSEGENNETDLFWNSKTNVWNNDRDSLYMFDSERRLAHYESYGY